MPAPAKRHRTWYTTDRVEAARRNIARHDWARAERDAAVANAERFLALADDELWRLVTPQSLPRSYAVNQELGSPVTGRDLFRFGRYPWQADPLNRPWKLVDPSSGYVFPTSDFGAYYRSGLDHQGEFDRSRADRRYLVNVLYPERGPDWGVDDGFGWTDETGARWTFIAYYVHWFLWYRADPIATAEPLIWDALTCLGAAYLYTDDARYARPGLILLDRIADLYPSMESGAYARADGFLASDGLRDRGKVLGGIWETALSTLLVDTYDALFPAIATDDEAGVVPYLSKKAAQTGHENPKVTPEDIRANIEHGIVRQIFPAVRDGRIHGNFGMHQHALALAAVVLDDRATSREWFDFLLQDGGYDPSRNPVVSGGNLLATLTNLVDRDGFGNESAPHYNALWQDQVRDLAGILDLSDDTPGRAWSDHPKIRRMFDRWRDLVMIGEYTPTIGDTPKCGNPGVIGRSGNYVWAFTRWGDPAYARHAVLLNGNTTVGLHGGIFDPDPDATTARIAAVLEDPGVHVPASSHLTGYGLSVLRDGVGDDARDLWLSYGRTTGHGHLDALNLGFHAFGIDLAPDLGYPEFADRNPKRLEWTSNTISHNTVTVDAAGQHGQWAGMPRALTVGGRLQVIDVEAPAAYPQTRLYRRVVAMIRIDARSSYAVDIFRVRGGAEHVYSFHGPEGPVSAEGLALTPQHGGSYAGADIPFGPASDPAMAAGGYSWLDEVERDTAPPTQFSLDWQAVDTWGVHQEPADIHLRLTMLGDIDDVALAGGEPSRNQPGNPARLRYALARRRGHDLESQFVSVIEPWRDQRAIRSIRRLPVATPGGEPVPDAVAIEIELAEGRVDYVISSLRPGVDLHVDGRIAFRGAFGLLTERDGRPESASLSRSVRIRPIDDPVIDGATPALTGTVIDFTRAPSRENWMLVRFDTTPEFGQLSGAHMHVEPTGERNAVYTIHGVNAEGPVTFRLDIGAATPINGRTGRGYDYDVAPGARFEIPLHAVWTAAD